MSRCVLIAGGGTGGHLFPGIAVAGELARLEPGLRLAFVSAGKALESQALSRAGFELVAIKAKPLVGGGLLKRLAALAALPQAMLRARGILKKYRPGLVLAVGGYAAFPLGLAAWLGGVPLAVQEQNAVPGLTNKYLGKLAQAVFAAYEDCRSHFPAGKVRLTGNPVRPAVISGAAQVQRSDPTQSFTVLVLGGSQGAASLNKAMAEAMPLLAGDKGRLKVIHQTGQAGLEEVRAAYLQAGIQAEVEAFFPDMDRLYGSAHLILCRAGASTLSEVCAVGRASVLVPYPFAAGDHQAKNAAAMVAAGASRLIKDSDLDGEKAAETISGFLDHPEELAPMEQAALGLRLPDAAGQIAAQCLALMKEAA